MLRAPEALSVGSIAAIEPVAGVLALLGTVDVDGLVVGEIEWVEESATGEGHGPAEHAQDDAAGDASVTRVASEEGRAELEHRRGEGGYDHVARERELVLRALLERAVRWDGMFGTCLTHRDLRVDSYALLQYLSRKKDPYFKNPLCMYRRDF